MPPLPPPGVDPLHVPLFTTATSLLAKHYRPGRHEVATAFLLDSGKVVSGIHVEGSAGRSSICAEGMALGAALIAGDGTGEVDEEVGNELRGGQVVAIVAVLFVASTGKIRVIAPCGLCRELLFDYCPDATIYTWLPASASIPSVPQASSSISETAQTEVDGGVRTTPTVGVGRGEGQQPAGVGFDIDITETAEGTARQWIVKNLMPDKTKRAGW